MPRDDNGLPFSGSALLFAMGSIRGPAQGDQINGDVSSITRGILEPIKVLLPIFLGFFITHVLLILYGIATQSENLPALIPETLEETGKLTQEMGWVFAVSLFLRAYSLGGGTYTGIEAVSNNWPSPGSRPASGRWPIWPSPLSFTAGGIILLYLLWRVAPVEGQTLNAVTFRAILAGTGWQNPILQDSLLLVVLALEGGLLLVAANTGFFGGPAVLANMAADSWVPHQYRYLSTRLVTPTYLASGLAAFARLACQGQCATGLPAPSKACPSACSASGSR